MELLDALCSTPNARSVPELSLSPHYHPEHNSIYKTIEKSEMMVAPDLIHEVTRKRTL